MSKTVRLNVRELVWESRHLDWNETDYKLYLQDLESFKDRQDGDWGKNNYRLFQFLSQYTWEQIYDFMQADEDDAPKFTYINHYYDSKEFTYESSIRDIIQEAMQEEVWENDIDEYESEDCNTDFEYFHSGDEHDD